MSETAFPDPETAVEAVAPETLEEWIDEGDDVAVFDVRAEGEYAEWRIEGGTVETVNVPYYELLEGVEDGHLDALPESEDHPLVVVCAKGGASEYVAGLLSDAGVDAVNLADGMNGWASIYESHEMDVDTDATVLQYQRPSSGCLSYLIVSGPSGGDGREAAVVDPLRAFADEYVRDAASMGADLVYAFDTHVHADHLSGVRELDARGVEGVIPAEAVGRGVTYADDLTTAEDGDVFEVGDVEVETLYTPGHTSGMTSYLVDGAVLLTGDGLFVESVARPDLEEGDDGAAEAARTLYRSLQERVLSLDDDTVVGGAHFSDAAEPAADGTYTATLGDLVEGMDALSMDEDEFVELVLSDMPPRPSNYEEIIGINLGRREAGDEEAFELELGPNNCAASRDALTD